MAYDAQGNEIEHVDAAGQVTRTEVGVFDRPTAVIEPDGARTEYRYDSELRLVEVRNPRGLGWSYEYDAAGDLVREADFNGRTLRYEYDEAGRLVGHTNGMGETTELVHDDVGNVVERRNGASVTRYEYAPTGRLLRAVNPHAEVVFQYDQAGRVVAETVNGRTVASRYDALGRRVGRRTPSGVESGWTFDANDLPTSLRTAGHTVRFGFDDLGREVLRRVEGGPVLRQRWDAVHGLVEQVVHPTADGGDPVVRRRFHHRKDGHVDAVEDDVLGLRRFDLDPAGQVTGVRAPGWQERYVYDIDGTLTEASWPAGHADTQGPRAYAGTLVGTAGDVRYEHDAQGRLTRRHRVSDNAVWRFAWDPDDQLVGVLTPDGTRWSYLYDPFGRRIAKLRLGPDGAVVERFDFTWDGDVLAEQAHSSGTVTTWEYDPGSLRLLTQTELAAGRRRFDLAVTDAVGTPTELVDASGTVTWRTRTTLWGVDASGSNRCPLRFPGQYHDPETGLSYNYYRYYDPATARYCSPDPLGLSGGDDPHGYVTNPLTFTDPLGLKGGNNRGPVHGNDDRLNWKNLPSSLLNRRDRPHNRRQRHQGPNKPDLGIDRKIPVERARPAPTRAPAMRVSIPDAADELKSFAKVAGDATKGMVKHDDPNNLVGTSQGDPASAIVFVTVFVVVVAVKGPQGLRNSRGCSG